MTRSGVSMALRRQLAIALVAGLAVSGGLSRTALAEAVPLACQILPDRQTVRIVLSNPASRERSCMASCQFQTPKYGGEVQIICALPVPAGAKDVEMCVKTSGGEELIKETFGSADCNNF